MVDIQVKAQGCIVGAAVGDALGMPTEYISKDELNHQYAGRVTSFQNPSPNHPCAHLRAGQYTDDTQQIILLAESLIEKDGFDLLDFGRKIGEWAHKCRTVPHYDRFSGGTSISAGLELYAGKDPYQTGKSRPTCGSAMRVAPLGVFYRNNLEELRKAAEWSSRVTHTHPAAIDSALFISNLIALLLNGQSPEEAVINSRNTLTSDLTKNIDYVIRHKHLSSPEAAGQIGASESCYETVPMAVHCFLHSPQNYEQTVVEAANLVPGDTDSIACIAGALSGAYNGYKAISSRFKEDLENEEKLRILGKRLAESSAAQKKSL